MALSYGFALQPADDSSAFADALYAVTGNGVTSHGGQFALTVNGFTVTLSAGFAFAAGRWVKNDEPYRLTVQPPSNNADRTDALVIRVNYEARKAEPEILIDIDPSAIMADPFILRNDNEYSVFLYFISIRRGATSLTPNGVTDLRENKKLCGNVSPLSAISGDILYVYNFLLSGIDQEVARLIGLSEQIYKKADSAIAELDEAIQKAGGTAEIGDLLISRKYPAPKDDWLLCDGGIVPSQYSDFRKIIGAALPAISKIGDRYRTYIYSGPPGEPEPETDNAIVGTAIIGIAKIGKEK